MKEVLKLIKSIVYYILLIPMVLLLFVFMILVPVLMFLPTLLKSKFNLDETFTELVTLLHDLRAVFY